MSLASRGEVTSPHSGAARGEDGQSPRTLRARAAGISQGYFWRWRAGKGVAKMALKMPIWVRDPHVSNRPLPDVQVVLIKEATRRWQTLHRAGRRRRSAWMFPLRSCRELKTASVVRWLLHRAASRQRKNAKATDNVHRPQAKRERAGRTAADCQAPARDARADSTRRPRGYRWPCAHRVQPGSSRRCAPGL